MVNATPEEVWRAWTTSEGVKRFFAPDARIDLKIGGAYEILFDPDEPEGKKGSEGSKILCYAPGRILSFTWGAPTQFERSRREIAQWVVVYIDPVSDGQTLVRLLEFGWRDDEEGEQVYKYFDRAWGSVLSWLAYSFAKGPVDWKNLPRAP